MNYLSDSPSPEMREKPSVSFWLITFSVILAGMIISFIEYYHTSIDGDIVPITLPMETYSEIFRDPFGLSAILHNEHYSGAGRWFIHISLFTLFNQCYFLITRFTSDKIEALYLTSTLFQFFCHWLMVTVIALYAQLNKKISLRNFLLAGALTVPFFQFNRCYDNFAIIDHALTYTAFYAFPLALLLIFFYPFFRGIIFWKSFRLSKPVIALMIVFGFCLAFSGPLIPVLGIMIGSVLLLIYYLRVKNQDKKLSLIAFRNRIRQIPIEVKAFLLPFMTLCAYDFYIGKYNIENTTSVSILERYLLLLRTIPRYFLQNGLPYCFVLLVINLFFFKRFYPSFLKTKAFQVLLLFALVIVIYIILLPLGGYRSYRPNILRYDVTMPLTIFLVISAVMSSCILFDLLKGIPRGLCLGATLLLLGIFWYQNLPIIDSRKEQEAMLRILASANSDSVIVLPYSSNFFAWEKISTPEKSYYVRQMIYKWEITESPVIFYQK